MTFDNKPPLRRCSLPSTPHSGGQRVILATISNHTRGGMVLHLADKTSTSIASAGKMRPQEFFCGRAHYENYREKARKSAPRKPVRTARKSAKTSNAAVIIRQMGNDWAQHWDAGILDNVVAAYAPDAVYFPPHHEAIHGRDAIREYLRGPLSHGVSDLAFDVT